MKICNYIGSVINLIPLQNSRSMVSEEIKQMTNEDLATALKNLGVRVGPITDTTRVVYERKLARVRQEMPQDTAPTGTTRSVYKSNLIYMQQETPRFAGNYIGSVINLIPLQNSRSMVSEEIKQMTNEDLATALKNLGVRVGPITDTTRVVYERKLARVRQEMPQDTAPTEFEEEEEEEEEEILSGSVREEVTSERSYDLPTKLTRSVTRRLQHDTSLPPDNNLDKLQGSTNRKSSQKQRRKTPKKPTPEEPFSPLLSSVPEKVLLPKHSVQNFDTMEPPDGPKSLPKSKIPRSSASDYTNSTVIYPDTNKVHTPRRSFGLSDSFHISPTSYPPESNTNAYSKKVYTNDKNVVTAYKTALEVNQTDSDESVNSQQDSDFDNPHNSGCDDPVEHFFKTSVAYSPMPKFNPDQEMDSSDWVYDTNEPTKQSEKFSSQIPNKWSAISHMSDLKTSPVFKKSNIPTSHIGQPKSLDKAQSTKKLNSIWKLDPVEEQNIHHGLSEIRTNSTDSSVKYDYLPKAFVEKYGKYMNKSGIDSTNLKNRQSIDSLLFRSHREQAKSSCSDSVAQVKAEKLTSAYQRYTSPLASKIGGGNNPPSYIGTPGSSRLNTSLTRRPLSSMREEVKFTSLRNTQASSASSASDSKKKGMSSIIIKLFMMIIFGVIVWLIYMNFESPATKPLLNADH